MKRVVLSTLNARYAHASLGLRYLRANLGAHRERSAIREFVIGQRTEEIAEQILAERPDILGLGVDIWNVEECTRLVLLLKQVAPDLVVVLGGPEVSYETDAQPICSAADYVITGWGDVSFAELVRALEAGAPPAGRIIPGAQPKLAELALPYGEYTEEDVAKRHLYVEASRGCPFKCEFCLSALDKTAWPFPLDAFMQELEHLYARGARQFKFVDRTFNLKVDTSLRILRFFLDKLAAHPDDPVFAHFELVPDHLPDRLKSILPDFPPGTLQFEIGIQTFNPDVQAAISRRQDNDAACANLAWLREHTRAHLHVDLIAGLPGEDLQSFAAGFDRLVALRPHEIQFGILKRLRGAPVARHTAAHDLRFNPAPPYSILSTDRLDFPTLQRMTRFARYWDLVANSGRFGSALPLLLGASPFSRFMQFSDWLYAQSRRTHAIAHERLIGYLHEFMHSALGEQETVVADALVGDYRAQGGRTRLPFDRSDAPLPLPRSKAGKEAVPKRQRRHLDSDLAAAQD